MNILFRLMTATAIATCSAALAQDPDPRPRVTDSYPFLPFKTPAEEVATLAERVKFGYESNGMGRRLNESLYRVSEPVLRCMAGTGDAGAAKVLWGHLADAADTQLTRMPEAEEIALEQYRLIGHTLLIYETAARYNHAASDECGDLRNTCLTGSANFHKAAAWYKMGEKLGDPVSARGSSRLARYANPADIDAAERDAEELIVKTRPLPDAVETYVYQCHSVRNE